MRPLPAFQDSEAKRLIKEFTSEHRVDVPLLKDLCEIMQGHSGAGRKHDVDSDIAACLDRFLERKPNL